MRRTPGQVDQLFVDWGKTGSTLGVRVDDLEGNTTIARATGFVERPAGSGLYYLDPFTFPTERGSYVLIFDDDSGTYALGHTATEDLEITSTAGEPFDGDTYGTTDELFRILKVREPSADQTAAAEAILAAATFEINQEIDLDDDDVLAGDEVSLVTRVCLRRAAELWALEEVRFGVLGVGTEFGATYLPRDTWAKYAIDLAPVKRRWGFA